LRPALIGKILGGVGLVLLLSSPYTLFITTGSSWLAALKALAGVALIGVYFGTNYGQLGQFASRKSSFFIASTALMGVFLIAALVGHSGYSHGAVETGPFILTLIGFVCLTVGGWLGGAVVFVHGMRVLSLIDEPPARAAAPAPHPEKEEAEA